MKLIFLNRFFYPDHSATSQMLSDLAFALAGRGQDVCVITSRQRYDAPAHVLPSREAIDHVSVHRIWASRFGRDNLLGRAIDYTTFYLSAVWRLRRLARSGDVVIAKTDPPMLSVIAGPVCRLRGARLVNWLQDIFPETAQALGVGGRAARVPYGALRWLRNGSLRAAHMNVVLGEHMADRVAASGVPRERIRIIANWADGSLVEPTEHGVNRLRAAWVPADAFVVGYSGNLGRAHEIDTLLDAIAIVEKAGASASAIAGRDAARPRPVLWIFIGGGALFERLKAEVARRELTSVRFKPYQPSALLAQSLGAADVHLVSLRPELEGLIVPSKFYGICAAARPTIFIGARDGEIARLIARHECGRTVAAGDGAALAGAVLELAADPDLRQQMGQRARQAFDATFDKASAVAHWETALLEVAGAAVRAPHTGSAPTADRVLPSRRARS